MILDLTSLQNAIAQLEEALEYCNSDLAKKDPRLARHLRAAAIQAFEFTYELSFKMLKRFLEETEANPAAVDDLSFKGIIRRAFERALVKREAKEWENFRKDRGSTSHAYNEEKAQDVFESIPEFLEEAKFLSAQLQKRQAD
jgi:nucleotidyltransferase substrate binding protein (TIGR01987 family)